MHLPLHLSDAWDCGTLHLIGLLRILLVGVFMYVCSRHSLELQPPEHRRDGPLPGSMVAEEAPLRRDEALLPAPAHVDSQLLPSPHLVLVLGLHEPDPLHDLPVGPYERGRYRNPVGRLLRHLLLLCTPGERSERVEGVTPPSGVEPIVRGYSYHTRYLLDLLCLRIRS